MDIIQRVTELAEEKVAGTDLFIVEVKMQPNRLLILVDGDTGVSVDKCAAISRHVGHYIEEENLIDHGYTLEVSSPGIGTPLKLKRQFYKNTGRMLTLKLLEGVKRSGRLLRVTEDSVFLEEKIRSGGKKMITTESEIPFSEISEARIVANW